LLLQYAEVIQPTREAAELLVHLLLEGLRSSTQERKMPKKKNIQEKFNLLI
jgi:hypothetical protein